MLRTSLFFHSFHIDISLEQPRQPNLRAFPGILLQYCTTLNLFPTIPPSNDAYELRKQRISTRTFIITLLFSSCIIFIYTAAAATLKTFTVSTPTLQQYKQLYQQHPGILTCLCTRISTKYESFIQIHHSLHEICFSVYTDNEWITHLGFIPGMIEDIDSQILRPHIFLGLRSMCQLAAESIRTNLDQFYSSNYVSAVATSENLLRSQSEAIVEQFISSTTNNFLLSLRLVGNITQANALASVLGDNFHFTRTTELDNIDSEWAIYGDNCNCAVSSACIQNVSATQNIFLPSRWYVPGFYIGCFIFEALRQSDLHCFYSQTCLDDLQSHWESSQVLQLQLLDPSALHYFDVMTSVGVIIDRLMVDVWNWTNSHGNYYGVCQPKECSYTKVARNDVVSIVTTVIGLIGGLVTVERLIIPKLISVAFLCIRRKRSNTVEIYDNGTSPVCQSPAIIQVEDLEN